MRYCAGNRMQNAPDTLKAGLARPDVRDVAKAFRKWANGGATLSAVCAGTFVLAESGLLNQQRATTTWWLAPMFRERYPQVLLDESDMVVKSGRFVTAGAALGHMDLALWLIPGSPLQFSPSSKSFDGMQPMRKSAKLPIMVLPPPAAAATPSATPASGRAVPHWQQR